MGKRGSDDSMIVSLYAKIQRNQMCCAVDDVRWRCGETRRVSRLRVHAPPRRKVDLSRFGGNACNYDNLNTLHHSYSCLCYIYPVENKHHREDSSRTATSRDHTAQVSQNETRQIAGTPPVSVLFNQSFHRTLDRYWNSRDSSNTTVLAMLSASAMNDVLCVCSWG